MTQPERIKWDDPANTLVRVEYRVVPITRYQVLRYEEGFNPAIETGDKSWQGSSQQGTFDNETSAFDVAYALAAAEQKRLGWPLDDNRMKFPKDDPRYKNMKEVEWGKPEGKEVW